jgi:hypothetical protein
MEHTINASLPNSIQTESNLPSSIKVESKVCEDRQLDSICNNEGSYEAKGTYIKMIEPDDYEKEDSENDDVDDRFMEFEEDHFDRRRGPSVDSESFTKKTEDDYRDRHNSTEMEQGDN